MAKAKQTRVPRQNRVARYLRETRAELRNVNWPTRQEAWSLTKIVLIVTVAMAVFLGILDYLFSLEFRGILVTRSVVAIVIAVVAVVAGIVIAALLSRRSV